MELIKAEKKAEEYNNLLSYNEMKEEQLKKQLSNAEINSIEYKSKFMEVKKEKEIYEILAEKNKREDEENRRQRHAYLSNSVALMEEKKKLESKLYNKEIEASHAKRDLNLIQETHEEVLEDKHQKESELEAMKEHAEVLFNQNKSVQC